MAFTLSIPFPLMQMTEQQQQIVRQKLEIASLKAGGEPIPGASSRALSRSIRNFGVIDPLYLSNNEQLSEIIDRISKDGDLILAQGAGSVSKLINRTIQNWQNEAKEG